jgi:aminoglycoside phosphotransferase (APT) family kinase protein
MSNQTLIAEAAKKYLGGDPSVQDLQALTGGAASATWRFDLTINSAIIPCILRLQDGAGIETLALNKTIEARVQTAATEAGLPVAKVLFVLQLEDKLGAGYVMERLPGASIPQKILADDSFAPGRRLMTSQCGEILAGIHAINTVDLAALPTLSAGPLLDLYEQSYRSMGQDLPAFELAFRWLKANAPTVLSSALVHGDFRNGNFLVDADTGITTVLDWELAHLGDPMEDLGWLCVNSWRFGKSELAVGGFGHREELFSAYEKAGGATIDPARVRFWELLGVLKWGVICLSMSSSHLTGEPPSLERAAIGRRVSETEIDLIQLLKLILKEPQNDASTY